MLRFQCWGNCWLHGWYLEEQPGAWCAFLGRRAEGKGADPLVPLVRRGEAGGLLERVVPAVITIGSAGICATSSSFSRVSCARKWPRPSRPAAGQRWSTVGGVINLQHHPVVGAWDLRLEGPAYSRNGVKLYGCRTECALAGSTLSHDDAGSGLQHNLRAGSRPGASLAVIQL